MNVYTIQKQYEDKSKRPLKLIAGLSPRTSVFERQLDLMNSPQYRGHYKLGGSSPRRKIIGAYNLPSPPYTDSGSIHSTRLHTPLDSTSSDSQSQGLPREVNIKIPLHRVRTTTRAVCDVYESMTRDHLEYAVSAVSYLAIGLFGVYGENVLHVNKEAFVCVVPLVGLAIARTFLVQPTFTRGSLALLLKEKDLPSSERNLVCGISFFLKALLLSLLFKTTSVFKRVVTYTSSFEMFTLLLMGLILICGVVSVFNEVLNLVISVESTDVAEPPSAPHAKVHGRSPSTSSFHKENMNSLDDEFFRHGGPRDGFIIDNHIVEMKDNHIVEI